MDFNFIYIISFIIFLFFFKLKIYSLVDYLFIIYLIFYLMFNQLFYIIKQDY